MSRLASDADKRAVGKRLARVRLQAHLNQPEFALSLGLSSRAYVNYERGEREAPLSVLRAIYEVYRIDAVWLMSGPGEVPVPARDLDLALLDAVVACIDRELNRTGKSLASDRRRHLIEVGYAQCRQQGRVDVDTLDRLVSVAA
jgi:transcriptional regulator with XRE-family HTH domain